MGVNREAAEKCFHRVAHPPAQLAEKEVKCDHAKVKFGIEARSRKNKLHNSISYCHLEDFSPKLQQLSHYPDLHHPIYLSALTEAESIH